MNNIALNDQVIADKLGQVCIVCANAADFGRGQIDLPDVAFSEPRLDGSLISQVKFRVVFNKRLDTIYTQPAASRLLGANCASER